MNRQAVLFALILPALIALAGCGPKSASLSATISDFSFEPDTWTVPAGATITLTLDNVGDLDHRWAIVEKGYTVEPPWDEEDSTHLLWEAWVKPGETATFTLQAPAEPGEYQVVCCIRGHPEESVMGVLIVTP